MAHQRNFWIPVLCGAIILTIGIGGRQSFGIFQKPIAADLDVGRELWSFSNALALLLMGVFAPFAGNLADRFGTARTVGAGGALYVAGMLIGGNANHWGSRSGPKGVRCSRCEHRRQEGSFNRPCNSSHPENPAVACFDFLSLRLHRHWISFHELDRGQRPASSLLLHKRME